MKRGRPAPFAAPIGSSKQDHVPPRMLPLFFPQTFAFLSKNPSYRPLPEHRMRPGIVQIE
jgi:hypothetical protein